jgi:hypothetical protein
MSDDDEVITIRYKKSAPPQNNEKLTKAQNGDGFVKTHASKQDDISSDPQQIKDFLSDFEQIKNEEYAKVEIGTFIRYIRYDPKTKKPQIRLGGYLIKNATPKYWVLKSGSKGKKAVSWSVPLITAKQGYIPNVYYRKKGLLPKDDKLLYGAEVYESLESGRFKLVSVEEIEKMTGQPVPGKTTVKQSSTRRPRLTQLINDDEDEEDRITSNKKYVTTTRRPTRLENNDDSEESRIKLVARFKESF